MHIQSITIFTGEGHGEIIVNGNIEINDPYGWPIRLSIRDNRNEYKDLINIYLTHQMFINFKNDILAISRQVKKEFKND